MIAAGGSLRPAGQFSGSAKTEGGPLQRELRGRVRGSNSELRALVEDELGPVRARPERVRPGVPPVGRLCVRVVWVQGLPPCPERKR